MGPAPNHHQPEKKVAVVKVYCHPSEKKTWEERLGGRKVSPKARELLNRCVKALKPLGALLSSLA